MVNSTDNKNVNPIIRTDDYHINGITKFKRKDGSEGWVKKDGTIIADRFLQVLDFHNGVGIFKRTQNDYGWLKEDGTIIIEGLKLHHMTSFDNNKIAIFTDNMRKQGIIKIDGTVITKGHAFVSDFEDGVAEFESIDGSKGYVNMRGRLTDKNGKELKKKKLTKEQKYLIALFYVGNGNTLIKGKNTEKNFNLDSLCPVVSDYRSTFQRVKNKYFKSTRQYGLDSCVNYHPEIYFWTTIDYLLCNDENVLTEALVEFGLGTEKELLDLLYNKK